MAQVIPQYRYTEGLGRRRLLTSDEVLRLPNDQLLIIIRGQKILRARKFDYTGHPYAKEMVRTSIQNYRPSRMDPAAAYVPQPSPVAPQPAPAPQAPGQDRPTKRKTTLYESVKPPVDF